MAHEILGIGTFVFAVFVIIVLCLFTGWQPPVCIMQLIE